MPIKKTPLANGLNLTESDAKKKVKPIPAETEIVEVGTIPSKLLKRNDGRIYESAVDVPGAKWTYTEIDNPDAVGLPDAPAKAKA